MVRFLMQTLLTRFLISNNFLTDDHYNNVPARPFSHQPQSRAPLVAQNGNNNGINEEIWKRQNEVRTSGETFLYFIRLLMLLKKLLRVFFNGQSLEKKKDLKIEYLGDAGSI